MPPPPTRPSLRRPRQIPPHRHHPRFPSPPRAPHLPYPHPGFSVFASFVVSCFSTQPLDDSPTRHGILDGVTILCKNPKENLPGPATAWA